MLEHALAEELPAIVEHPQRVGNLRRGGVDDIVDRIILLDDLPRIDGVTRCQTSGFCGIRPREGVVQFVAQRALDDGGEELDVILPGGDMGARRIGGHRGGSLRQVAEGDGFSAHDVAQQEVRRDEADVGLDVLVEVVFGIGGRIDIQTARHEEPHADGEVVLAEFAPCDEPHLEFD